MAVGQHHDNRRDAYMAAGEGGCGAFTSLMSHGHQMIEESVSPTWRWQHFGVAAEIGAERREMTLQNLINAHGLEVELRARDREENIDKVVEEKSGLDNGGDGDEG